jgi:hypothetical protein
MIKLKVKTLNKYHEKIKGLIGQKKFSPIYFQTRFGIQTFGMLKSIDVLILNDNNVVQVIRKNLKPNQIFFWNPLYKNVLEAPVDCVKANVGDKISIQT